MKKIGAAGLILLIAGISCMCCKTSAKNESAKIASASDSITTKNSVSVDYFKVAFISMGSGIDRQAKQKYDAFVKKFETDNSVKMMLEVLRLGKEGETNYCFDLTPLSKNKRKKFVSGSQEILDDSQLVHTYLNARCH